MRFLLATTALGAIAIAAPASAETVISTAVTTPQTTSASGDIRISSTGSVKPTSGVAVTVNTNNFVKNEGTVQITVGDDNAMPIAWWYREPPKAVTATPSKAEEKKAFVAGATMVASGGANGPIPILTADLEVTGKESFLDREVRFARRPREIMQAIPFPNIAGINRHGLRYLAP